MPDPAAAALARCRADGFTCQDAGTGVVGVAGGTAFGSNCDPGNRWRMYCYATGMTSNYCVDCVRGNIYPGHSPCRCNSGVGRLGTWCEL